MEIFEIIINFIKELYPQSSFIPLHAPVFIGNEKKYLSDCIDSTYVSYVGEYVSKAENKLSEVTGSKYVVTTASGTSALHIALLVAGVKANTEVITTPLTFVGTCNAILHCNACPVFIDIERSSLGLDPAKLDEFLKRKTVYRNNNLYNRITGRQIKAILPVHVFGHPAKIKEIVKIADQYNLPVIEDAAEAIGSLYNSKHCGTFGKAGILSFNGNKVVTAGGGGAILTDDEKFAEKAKHIISTAKIPHKYYFFHDELGYNYRMPALNAAVLLAQLENLEKFIYEKREIAKKYKEFFAKLNIEYLEEPINARSNYWLNTILLKNEQERDAFLEYSHQNQVQTRAIWNLMPTLPYINDYYSEDISTAINIQKRGVNLPSGVRI